MNFPIDRKELDVKLKVGDVFGFDVNGTALIFGTIIPGSSGQRKIVIENTHNFPVFYEFKAEGEVKRFLMFDKIITLDVGEKKDVEINAVVPIDEEFREYTGKMIVLVRRKF